MENFRFHDCVYMATLLVLTVLIMACIFVPLFSKVLSQSSLVSTKKTAVSLLDFSASLRCRPVIDLVLV